MKKDISELINRGLEKLQTEIEQYPNDDSLWLTREGISNSGGNLCLHICGNLQHFIGGVLGDSGYERKREVEFESSGQSKTDLINEIGKTQVAIKNTLDKLNANVLDEQYPIDVLNKSMTTRYFLMHLQGHLNYHLGQINYHRKLLAR